MNIRRLFLSFFIMISGVLLLACHNGEREENAATKKKEVTVEILGSVTQGLSEEKLIKKMGEPKEKISDEEEINTLFVNDLAGLTGAINSGEIKKYESFVGSDEAMEGLLQDISQAKSVSVWKYEVEEQTYYFYLSDGHVLWRTFK